MIKLFPRRDASDRPNPASPRPAGPIGRTIQWFRDEAQLRTSVVLPQYTRPGPPTFIIVFGIVLALASYVYGFGFSIMAPVRVVQFLAPIAVLGALAVWALPEMGKAPTVVLERLAFAFILSIPLWPNYLAIVLPGMPWITVARLIGFPLVFFLAVSISVSRTFRAELKESLDAVPLLWRAVAAFAAIQVVTIAVSSTPQISLQKVIVYSVNWIVMFFAAAYVFRAKGRSELFAALLIVMAVIVSVIALLETRNGQILWANHIPSFLAVDDPSVQRMFATAFRAGTNIYRAQATYGTPLGLGEFLAITTPFVLHVVGGPGFRLWLRAAALATLPLILMGILTTDTRLGMVGFILSIGVYIFFWGLLQWRERPRSLIGPAVVLSYPATALAFMVAVMSIQRLRVMTIGGGKHQASTEARYDQWGEGIPMVFSHPWGHGAAKGAGALGFRNPAGTLTIDSYWLATALDYGVLGFVTFYGAFLIAVWAGFRTVARGVKERELTLLIPLTIALFVYFVVKSVYAGVENQSIAFMMLGCMTALVWRAKKAQEAPPAPEPRAR